jgi:SAM-dependent methyltransferase
MGVLSPPFLEVEGTCPTCDTNVVFRSEKPWLRDHLLCPSCGSIPRERAIMRVIEQYYPGYRDLQIHEAGAVMRGASVKLRREAKGYLLSQYDPSLPFGSQHPSGYRSEDLESQTFPDASFDLVVTQDVLEHVFEPARAFAEISRTLRPGGAHVFTTPLLRKREPTQCRARRNPDGTIEHLFPPEYHGNPMDSRGSLVTYHWGYDICHLVFETSGMWTTIVAIDDLRFGIRAELNEVLVSLKR